MSQSQLFVKNNMKASVKMSCKVLNCFELIDFIVFLSFFCIFKKRCPAHRVDNEIKASKSLHKYRRCIECNNQDSFVSFQLCFTELSRNYCEMTDSIAGVEDGHSKDIRLQTRFCTSRERES